MSWITQYLVAAVAFCVLDFIWLGTIANNLYAAQLGDLLAPKTNLAAAVAFYAIFLAGLVFFVIHPAIADGSWTRAAFTGAFFGLVCYATWDLTNLAVVRGFPVTLALIDMSWGTVLAGSVSLATYGAATLIPALR